MKSLFCFFFALGIAVTASAQKVYFIYLQTENGSPFYVRMGDKIHSSSTSGYLILSNLVDSTYQLALGFPSSNAESKFRIAPSGKDKGFLVKNFDFGIGLFDMQALTILKPMVDQSQDRGSYRMKNDDFTVLLSKAARDTSLLWVPVFAKNDVAIADPPKPEPVLPKEPEKKQEEKLDNSLVDSKVDAQKNESIEIVQKDTIARVSLPQEDTILIKDDDKTVNENDNPDLKKDTLAAVVVPLKIEEEKKQPVEYKRSEVRKYSESSTSEGFGLVFFDSDENGTDTIRLLIPNPPVLLKQDDNSSKEGKQFLDITNTTDKQTPTEKKDTDKNVIPKTNCSNLATESDFLKLRKNMAGEETDEGMVDVAKKYFRNKCFSTEQVKNLSVLFLTSAGKYLFFDAAYFHVSDREKFRELGTEIKDDYYQKRFKALIGE